MIKKIRDISYREFSEWCNMRACDGRWSMVDAIVCISIINEVNSIQSLFKRNKKREERWDKLKYEKLNLELEIEV